MQAKQATSLRVDQALYEKLAVLTKARGTSITRQLEMAIRRHLEGAVVEDYLPILEPVIERVVQSSLEATVTARIEQMKQRLASLLAKNALDTAVIYMLQTRQMTREEMQTFRKWAADHVRGRLADIKAEGLTADELDRLRTHVKELAAEVQLREKAATDQATAHREEVQRLREQLRVAQTAACWYKRVFHWLAQEWEKTGLLGRRKP
ncbi:MAG: hypothetical protein ACOY93_19535 [Bacillota bacterium]